MKLFLLLIGLLFSLTISAGSVEIDGMYFNIHPENYTADVTYKTGFSVLNKDAYVGDIVIPSVITVDDVEYAVTGIGPAAFFSCSEMTSVFIPSSIKTIDGYAFSNCSGLRAVKIADIHDWFLCTIADNPLTYGHNLYLNDEIVTDLVIPDDVTAIPSSAFAGASFKSVTFGSAVKTIGADAFSACNKLEQVHFNDGIITIGDQAFQRDSLLTELIMPAELTTLGKRVFSNCIGLEKITFGPNLTQIAAGTFNHCDVLKDITFPEALTNIGSQAFYVCKSLEHINLPENLEKIETSAFFDCSALKDVVFPNSLKTLAEDVFSKCTALESITLGKKFTSGGPGCFSGCTNLKALYSHLEAPIDLNSAFLGYKESQMTLFADNDKLDAYHKISFWKGMKSIKPFKCATPVVICENGYMQFSSDTNLQWTSDKETYEYTIHVNGLESGETEEGVLNLEPTYTVFVHGSVPECEDSEEIQVTLSWLNSDPELCKEGDVPTEIEAIEKRPVIFDSRDGSIRVSGLRDGEEIAYYSTAGRLLGTAKVYGGIADFQVQTGQIIIARVGGQGVRILAK